MKKSILKLIKFYQRYLSLDQGLLRNIIIGKNSNTSICRHFPTCSEYTYQAVSKYGISKGLVLGTKRIVKCNPLNKGGLDPLL